MNLNVTHRIHQAGTALASGLAADLLATSAQADDPGHHPSVVVSYDDLNIASAAGAQALYARINSAADRACGGEPAIRELRLTQQYDSCVDAAVEQAVHKVDSARLQALHAERKATATVG